MPKYIDADAFKSRMSRYTPSIYDSMMRQKGFSLEEIEGAVDAEPAADVEPVRHGHWVYKMRERIRYENVTGTDPLGETHTVTVKTHVRGPVPYCSLCDALAADSFLDYCPRCGAKMDGEEK